ncbi:MAG: prepilin peptidase [bacterium]|nr:prepilin peptidase [bacterium]MDP3770908.1 prepilin peptidase [bacterium]
MTVFLTAIAGLAFGSFMNVLIDRVPAQRSIRGRSACDRCRRTLRWWELVPVMSALLLRHRCSTCGGAIAFRTTLVELGAAAILVSVVLRHGGLVTMQGALEAFTLLSLGTLAVIDLRQGIVPDQISLPAIVAVLAVKALFIIHYSSFIPQLLLPVVIGAGWFAIQRWISKGRWVGDGDTRVGALMGALFAPVHLLLALAASYIIGGAFAGALLVTRRVNRGAHIPLVPFLFLGSVVVVLWGERIVAWYGW